MSEQRRGTCCLLERPARRMACACSSPLNLFVHGVVGSPLLEERMEKMQLLHRGIAFFFGFPSLEYFFSSSFLWPWECFVSDNFVVLPARTIIVPDDEKTKTESHLLRTSRPHSPELLVHERIATAQAEGAPHPPPGLHGQDDVSVHPSVQRRPERHRIAIHLVFYCVDGSLQEVSIYSSRLLDGMWSKRVTCV